MATIIGLKLEKGPFRPNSTLQKSACFQTLFRPMEFSIKLHTVKSGWSIVYIEGSHVIISKNYGTVFLFLKMDFVMANSV